jgi:hypothetical protein
MAKKFRLFRDSNGNPVNLIRLNDPQEVLSGAQSLPIDGKAVRIFASDGAIRFLIGENPVADATSHALADQTDIYQPCNEGDKVSVFGGPANIATVGEE